MSALDIISARDEAATFRQKPSVSSLEHLVDDDWDTERMIRAPSVSRPSDRE